MQPWRKYNRRLKLEPIGFIRQTISPFFSQRKETQYISHSFYDPIFSNWLIKDAECPINSFPGTLMNRKSDISLRLYLPLSHTLSLSLLSWQIAIWFVLPQIPPGLYLFRFHPPISPTQPGKHVILISHGLQRLLREDDGWYCCFADHGLLGFIQTTRYCSYYYSKLDID